MTPGATLVASLLMVLERPGTWPPALLGFLVRGGLLVVLAPIIVLPSAIGLANILAPLLSSALLGGLTPVVLVVVFGVAAVGLAWIVGGGLLAAVMEAASVRLAAGEADRGPAGAGVTEDPSDSRDVAWRILAVRLVAHIPLALALVWAAGRVVAVVYREFTVPVDTVTPLILRVARAMPESIALVVVAWLVGEIIGGLAARRVILADDGALRSLRWAISRLVRHPLRTAAAAIVPLAALIVVLVPSAAAASAAWWAIRIALVDDLPAVVTLLAVVLLVVVWGGQLVLLGLIAAWRGSTWTLEVGGTFGGVPGSRAGDWSAPTGSGSVSDPSGPATRSGSEGDR